MPHTSSLILTAEKKKRKRQTGVMQEDRLPGTTTLPVARVQRIVKADKEIQMMNKESIFLLSVATVSVAPILMTELGVWVHQSADGGSGGGNWAGLGW